MDFSEAELAQGRSRNYVADPDYKDPAEEGTLGADESDERKLDDWFFSLIKTMRADMSSEKLYPSGRVYQMVRYPRLSSRRIWVDFQPTPIISQFAGALDCLRHGRQGEAIPVGVKQGFLTPGGASHRPPASRGRREEVRRT